MRLNCSKLPTSVNFGHLYSFRAVLASFDERNSGACFNSVISSSSDSEEEESSQKARICLLSLETDDAFLITCDLQSILASDQAVVH